MFSTTSLTNIDKETYHFGLSSQLKHNLKLGLPRSRSSSSEYERKRKCIGTMRRVSSELKRGRSLPLLENFQWVLMMDWKTGAVLFLRCNRWHSSSSIGFTSEKEKLGNVRYLVRFVLMQLRNNSKRSAENLGPSLINFEHCQIYGLEFYDDCWILSNIVNNLTS